MNVFCLIQYSGKIIIYKRYLQKKFSHDQATTNNRLEKEKEEKAKKVFFDAICFVSNICDVREFI